MRKLLVLILLALIAAKAAAVVALGPVPIERDAAQYWKMSTYVMGGDWLIFAEPVAYRVPVYPWFLAIVRALAGPYSLPVIVGLQTGMMVMSLLLAGFIATRITRLPSALVWTLLVALPITSAFSFSAALLTESLFIFLLMLHLCTVLHYDDRPTGWRATLLGLTFGLTLLTRPIILLLWVVYIPLFPWLQRRRRNRVGKNVPQPGLIGGLGHAALAAVTVCALVAPWVLRNKAVFDEYFLTEFVGRNLWVVTFQDGSGAGLEFETTEASEELERRLNAVASTDDWRLTWTVSNALVQSGLRDDNVDRLMRRVAMESIDTNREIFGKKAARRIINFWRAAATELPPQGSKGSYRRQFIWKYDIPVIEKIIDYRLSQSVWLNTVVTGLIVAAGLILLFNSPSRPYAFWILLVLAYFSVVTGIFEIPAYRYRIVVEPIAAGLAGAAIAVLISRRRKPATVVPSN
ncbi:MAG: hypothetical protein AAGG48_08770 [Planctomycetota bacterium]